MVFKCQYLKTFFSEIQNREVKICIKESYCHRALYCIEYSNIEIPFFKKWTFENCWCNSEYFKAHAFMLWDYFKKQRRIYKNGVYTR